MSISGIQCSLPAQRRDRQARNFPRLAILALVLAGLPMFTPAQGQLFPPPSAPAQPSQRSAVQAAINTSALEPGQQAVIAVVVDIGAGYHAQSHTPSSSDFIPLKVTVMPDSGITAFEPIYPPGEDHNYPQLGRLNVYQGRVIVYVPLQIKSDAAVGALKLSGMVGYQICNDGTCFPPERHPFEISTSIVPAAAAVTPNKPELFKRFDFAIFPKLLKGGADTSESANPPGKPFRLFGATIGSQSYLLAFAAALLVGLIFNVMPCVLPVLPLKIIGFYETSQHNRARSFSFGVAFSAGIVATFAMLSSLILFHGRQWGDLFSHGWFIWSIVAILVVMSVGAFGKFSVRLPSGIYNLNPRHDTYVGNFAFGILTAILSTPCTAPIFPGLLAWATAPSLPRAVGVGIFLAVGVGMALPYLVLSAIPEVARKLPRSGPWSEIVKQMMGFLLLGVAAYFAGLRLLPGTQYIWLVFVVAVAAAIFLVARTVQLMPRARPIGVSLVLALAMCAGMAALVVFLGREPLWQAYTSENLAAAQRQNDIVLVEFTANWCANCQYVAATVFPDPRAQEAFRKYHVRLLRADLTTDDAPGWVRLRQLSSTGGIPLTAIYSSRLSQPIQLTSIYTVNDLLAALKQAAGDGKSVAMTIK